MFRQQYVDFEKFMIDPVKFEKRLHIVFAIDGFGSYGEKRTVV